MPDAEHVHRVVAAACAEFALTPRLIQSYHKGGRFTAAREVCCHLVGRDAMNDDELAVLLGLHRSAILKMRRSAAKRMKMSAGFAEKARRVQRAAASKTTDNSATEATG